MSKLDIESIAGGAAAEIIDVEYQKVLENLYDPNTSDTKARKLTITLTYKPDVHDREIIRTNISVKSTLCPVNDVNTDYVIDCDGSGNVVAQEWVKGVMANQISINDVPEKDENNENETKKIIDFQSKVQ